MSPLLTKRRTTVKARVELEPTVAERKSSAAYYAGARDWATPRLETALGSAKEATRTTVDEVVPKVTTAVTAALAASEPVMDEVRTRGTAAIAALKGELNAPPPRRRRRKGRVLVLLAVLAGAFAGWRAWSRNQADDQWQDQWSSAAAPAATTVSDSPDSSVESSLSAADLSTPAEGFADVATDTTQTVTMTEDPAIAVGDDATIVVPADATETETRRSGS